MATRTRGEYAKSAQRRREIVTAAVEVFGERGFREGSLRDIADRAGITYAGLRHHFPTKAGLLEAVLRWREEESVQRAGPTDGLDLLRAWIADVASNVKRPALVELETVIGAEAISPEHSARPYFAHLYGHATKLLTRAFTTAAEHGQLRDGVQPEAAAQIVLGVTVGLQTLWLHDRSIDVPGGLTTAVRGLLSVDLPLSGAVNTSSGSRGEDVDPAQGR